MKFHAAILAPNGQVSAKEWRDSDVDVNDPLSRKMMSEFKDLLREHLTDDPTRTGKFRGRFGDRDHGDILEFEWQQAEPLSALGKFYVRGQVAAASFYLHGSVPELDDAVLEATAALFRSWFGPARSEPACHGLRSIKERPLLVVMPGDKGRLSPDNWRIIGNLCPCFATVFFKRAEAGIKAVEKVWADRLGKKTDYLWN